MNFFPQPCKFPRVSGHPFHHGMTNQNGQGQVLGGQSPSESAKLRAKQGHATSAKRNRFSAFFFLKFRIPHFAFPNKIPPSRPFRPLRAKARPGTAGREQSAFSLTEVVIAMGVAAVAFTSIIALFPLGLNMSRESYEATQAALIAQTILADLKDELTGSGTIGSSRFIQIGGNSDPTSTANYLAVNFNTASTITVYLAYKQALNQTNDTDPSGQPIMLRPCAGIQGTAPAWYDSGSNGLTALVKVTATPCFRINGTGASSNPMRVDISIETPGNVPLKNRSQFLFTGGTPPK